MDGDGTGRDVGGEPRSGTAGKAFGSATEVEVAWAAGLFEGEGSIWIARSHGNSYPRITVASNDTDVLEKFQRIIGCGRIRIQKTNPKHTQQYKFVVSKQQQVRDAFYAMYPWLGERRQKRGLEVLAECAKPRE